MDAHTSTDWLRDTASEFVAGLLVVVIGGSYAVFRRIQDRLGRHGNEIRHTQKETAVEPLYPEYPADKL